VFMAWDLLAIVGGVWDFDSRYVLGIHLPGGIPLEEVLFFLVVPTCAPAGPPQPNNHKKPPPPRGAGRPPHPPPRVLRPDGSPATSTVAFTPSRYRTND
ncbi:lycopene cyclase domain-containing protein, partial [Nocardia flavorosea]|uniref:lycopene cyclase domain-containing protein n=1 Tax=Nocardia flavorosea TaxID=53429 RepID=UPI00245520F6